MRSTIALLVVWTLLCSTAQAQNIQKDLSYASPALERQILDVYAPKDAKQLPVVFWIHGGGWQAVSLAVSGGIDVWRQWSFRYQGPAGLHSAEVRATDLDGNIQPEQRTKVFPDGARGWHQIQFTSE